MATVPIAPMRRESRSLAQSAWGAEAVLPPARLATLIAPLGAPWQVTLRIQGTSGDDGSELDVPLAERRKWLSMSAFLRGLPTRHQAAVGRDGDPRQQAAELVPWSAALPAAASVLPALLLDVLPVTGAQSGPAEWLVHEHRDGYLDGVALPAGTSGRSRVASTELAASVASLVGPWLAGHAAVLPITERTAWGGVVDALTGSALAAARAGLGASPDVVWDRLTSLIDQLAKLAPLPGRPRRVDIVHGAGTSLFPVRSTCCLHYRTCAAPDRDGDGYCVTCPLRTDASRQQRLAAHLDQTADAAS